MMRTKFTIVYKNITTGAERKEEAFSDHMCVSIDELALHWGSDDEYVDNIWEENVQDEKECQP